MCPFFWFLKMKKGKKKPQPWQRQNTRNNSKLRRFSICPIKIFCLWNHEALTEKKRSKWTKTKPQPSQNAMKQSLAFSHFFPADTLIFSTERNTPWSPTLRKKKMWKKNDTRQLIAYSATVQQYSLFSRTDSGAFKSSGTKMRLDL